MPHIDMLHKSATQQLSIIVQMPGTSSVLKWLYLTIFFGALQIAYISFTCVALLY